MSDNHENEWFRKWFDSPYYHLLYMHRDQQEAGLFLQNLLEHISLPRGAEILDLACGKGRHSIFLHSKGYNVTGIDLSVESITIAKKQESPGLHFIRDDMRTFSLNMKFDCILNLFTSFGYFEHIQENRLVLDRVKAHLKPQGIFVLDYFNSLKVMKTMQPCYHKNCGKIDFDITKDIRDGEIVKKICITDEGEKHHFEERVQLLSANDIQEMLSGSGLEPVSTFGDYALGPFDPETSDRFIIIASN
jgi:2-polyprenyl-3-methyl-5-hydroxy-6-metoxy-1,4-benzoquinol methylase